MPGPRLPPLRRPAFGRPPLGVLLLGAISYLPLLLTHRGKLGADTKAYLYLDPGQLMGKAPYLWDPSVGLGTVTHQNIGYLFPMGPYYWLMEAVGMPDWIAQRLWMGSIIFLAGMGVRYLLRTLRWEGPGVTVASVAYALSPYLLHYIYKHSVILLPFTALPWLVAYTARALRQPGWRYPALFALVALASGGINATSLLLVLIGPALWVLHAVLVEREVTWRAAIPPIARIGVLGVATSLWWVAGLALQGAYGIDVLKFTETYRTVSDASTSAEVGRSLGYWFFYGVDTFGPWFKAAATFTQSPAALALSFLVPIVCVACALWVRFRYRIFFVGLALVGLVVSVGGHPWDGPSLYGRLFRAFTDTDSGLALRSTPRAVPLLALGLATFLGAGVAAASRRLPAQRLVFASAALVMVMANMSPLFMGRMIDPFLERPDDVPEYWHEVGRHLDEGDRSTRALEIPGIEFANYRWGASVDPITPGLTDRDYAARELVPYGSNASANLMNAIDTPLQDGSFDPSSYSTVLRLLSVGDLVVRNDLEYERFRTPRPRPLERQMSRTPGLGEPRQFGTDDPNTATPVSPLVDDLELRTPDTDPDPHAVSVYPVEDAPGVVHTVPADRPQILAGDGAGVVTAAEAGVLDPDRLVVYSGTVSGHREQFDALVDRDAELILTDTNRKAGRRWGTTKDNDGYTELADETLPPDPSDNRLDLFGGRGPDVQTVSVQAGGVEARASGYGNPLSFTPGDRAVNAVDGDPTTAWRVGAFSDVRGEWLQLRLPEEDRPGALTLTQPTESSNRTITEVRLTFDGRDSLDVALTDESRGAGQRIDLGDRRFRTLRITVVATQPGVLGSYKGLSGVGFTEAALDGYSPTVEVIRPPVDLLDAAGSAAKALDLSVVLRRRTAPPDSGAVDEETRLVRQLDLPAERSFEVSGKLRLHPDVPDSEIDRLLGVGGATMTSSSGLRGDVRSRASKAFDGDDDTSWQSQMAPAAGEWVEIAAPAAVTGTISGLRVLADGRHSVPSVIHLEIDGIAQAPIELPKPRTGERGTVRTLAFETPVAFTGTTVRIVVDEFREVTTPDWYTHRPVTLPLSITGVESPKLEELVTEAPPALLDCRSDVVTVDGQPVPVMALLDGDDALDGAERGELVPFEACDPSYVTMLRLAEAAGLDDGAPPPPEVRADLGDGATRVETTLGSTTALDVDQLLLRSAGSDPAVDTGPAGPAGPTGTTEDTGDGGSARRAPDLEVTRDGPVAYEAKVADATDEPYWLILGQSSNDGWHLTVDGEDLGPSTLVSGYANGWYIDPAEVGASPTFRFEWEPQGTVWIALAVSAVGFLLCLVLALRPAADGARTAASPTLHPQGLALLDTYGRPVDWVPTALASVGVAAATAVFVGYLWALPGALLMLAALRTDLGWRVLRFAVVGALGLAAAYVVLKQMRNAYPLDFDWPQHFEAVHSLGMFAYALLGIECVTEALRAGWRRDTDLDG